VNDRETERRGRFDALFFAHSADIVAYCGWRAGSADAQDAAAEVFLIAWRRMESLPEGDAARVWLYATARKVIANQRRSSRRRSALHERLAREAMTAPRRSRPTRSRRWCARHFTGSAQEIARSCSWPSGRGSRRRRSGRSSVVSR
jgi:DNA-directed RNA polymerase specialized sigma24 family protein